MARGHVAQWMLWYWYCESGWLHIRRGHSNIHGTCVLILLLVAVGAVHFDVVEIPLVGRLGRQNFFITIVVIILEKSQNRYVHQVKVAQGQTPTRPQIQTIGLVVLPYQLIWALLFVDGSLHSFA